MSFIIDSIEKVIEVPLEDACGFLFCTIAGVIVNWLYKCKREKIQVKAYWTENLKSSGFAIAGALAAFITTLIIEPGVGKATYFAIGIASDSMLNKPPLPAAVKIALERLEALQNGRNPNVNSTVDNVAVPLQPNGVHDSEGIDAATRNAVAEVGKHFASGDITAKADSEKSNS